MLLKPKRVISITFTVLILILALPASAIMASWNSLPGDTLYPIKRSLEKASLTLLPSSFLEMRLRYTFLDQRTTEAIATVQTASNTRALDDIVTEAQAAKLALVSLKTNAQPEATEQLIEKLAETNRELETVKLTTQQPTTNNSGVNTPESTKPLTNFTRRMPGTIIYQPTTIIYKTVEPETPIADTPVAQTYSQPLIPETIEEPQLFNADETPSVKSPTQTTTSQPSVQTEPLPPTITTPTITPPSTPTAPSTPQTTDQQIHQTQLEISRMIVDLQQQSSDHQEKLEKFNRKNKKDKDGKNNDDWNDDHDDRDDD